MENLEEEKVHNPWFGYFPIVNTDNIERLEFLLNEDYELLPNTKKYVSALLRELPDSVLMYFMGFTYYQSKHDWFEININNPNSGLRMINIKNGSTSNQTIYLEGPKYPIQSDLSYSLGNNPKKFYDISDVKCLAREIIKAFSQ